MTDPIRFSRQQARHDHADRWDRGTNYNDRHLADVEIESDAANRFVVRFPDSDDAHVVHLAADEGEWVGKCTCGDFEYRQTVCKHMWAVLADPSTAVLDRAATQPDRRAIADGGAVATAAPANGKAPSFGSDVERWMADRYPIEPEDAKYYDARLATDTGLAQAGAPVQIKTTRIRVRNGYDQHGNQKYTRGRLTFWREELLHNIQDGGLYLVGVYRPDRNPRANDFVTNLFCI
ncbi:SWIM zinc finger family protein [Halanaeroarchaeum sulfurireducens]|uniref:SWIM-type domain-containing protein n=1 Tax=Halanaeroarchaeum sulfurireducens TaxID=1604004 RepID=A0A0F7PDF1_9EURY|nr:SWIM zinc finger family protein [Halanaeroarchaeum sulfurireducens]AKH98215.1 hypothetical protein HLASF_1742 [Halanaeroarchaeum sulfurireducens]ALG82609.1 hypothetical protein HLASA_1728 [Halanaeroarchaeum sulfurireducens]